MKTKPTVKNPKVQIRHPMASGIHAKFVKDGIIDMSTNGTYLGTRYRDGLAHIPSSASIYCLDYKLRIIAWEKLNFLNPLTYI